MSDRSGPDGATVRRSGPFGGPLQEARHDRMGGKSRSRAQPAHSPPHRDVGCAPDGGHPACPDRWPRRLARPARRAAWLRRVA